MHGSLPFGAAKAKASTGSGSAGSASARAGLPQSADLSGNGGVERKLSMPVGLGQGQGQGQGKGQELHSRVEAALSALRKHERRLTSEDAVTQSVTQSVQDNPASHSIPLASHSIPTDLDWTEMQCVVTTDGYLHMVECAVLSRAVHDRPRQSAGQSAGQAVACSSSGLGLGSGLGFGTDGSSQRLYGDSDCSTADEACAGQSLGSSAGKSVSQSMGLIESLDDTLTDASAALGT